ncbi:hypothetical protein J7M28_00825 [bacterium]|nr:hypothetical protein [bacterium]
MLSLVGSIPTRFRQSLRSGIGEKGVRASMRGIDNAAAVLCVIGSNPRLNASSWLDFVLV